MDSHIQYNEVGSLLHNTYNTFLKTHQKLTKYEDFKRIKENTEVNLHDPELGTGFWGMMAISNKIKYKIDKLNFSKTKTFHASKNTIKKAWKDMNKVVENIWKSHIYKGLVSRIYKQLLQLTKKMTTQFKTGQMT